MSNMFFRSISQSSHSIIHAQKLHPNRFLTTITSKDSSFTVSYLIKSCGLSPEHALKASKYVKFDNPNRPDSVLETFKNHGFSQTQISILVRRQPMMLLVNPRRTILPKIEFFKSKGLSQSDVAELFSKFPAIMKSHLDNQIIPAFAYFRDILKSDEVVLAAGKRYMAIFTHNLGNSLLPNVKVLRDNGVPDSNIYEWFKYHPRSLMGAAVALDRSVKDVKAMGFDPSKRTFLIAATVLSQLSGSAWQRKVEVYVKWGWSEKMIDQVFRVYPWFMMTSEDKIMAIMDFIVNKTGWDSLLIIKFPQMMNMSLEKRIVPRVSVIKVLMSKGLVKNRYTMRGFFGKSDKVFVEKYIKPFENEVPELLKIYKANVVLS